MSLLNIVLKLDFAMNMPHQSSVVGSYMVSKNVAEQEIQNLRKELSEANAKLKNVLNSVAMEAGQRSNQRASQVTKQYEKRFEELRTQLEADCKKVVADTVNFATEGIQSYKEEVQLAMEEWKHGTNAKKGYQLSSMQNFKRGLMNL